MLAGKDGYDAFSDPSIELMTNLKEAPTHSKLFSNLFE